jgi:hypothetical protein
MDDIWFTMHKEGWPTLKQAAILPKPAKKVVAAATTKVTRTVKLSSGVKGAVAKALAALTFVSTLGSTCAETVLTSQVTTHEAYGVDFAAFALTIMALIACYIILQFCRWVSPNRVSALMTNCISVIIFVTLPALQTTESYSLPSLWLKLRESGWAEAFSVASALFVVLASLLWARVANWHYRAVKLE